MLLDLLDKIIGNPKAEAKLKIISDVERNSIEGLLQAILTSDKNSVFSPLALRYALIQLAGITVGTTQKQILKVLSLNKEGLSEEAGYIRDMTCIDTCDDKQSEFDPFPTGARDNTKSIFNFGSLICADSNFEIKEEALRNFIEEYKVDLLKGKFGNSSFDKEIHQWLNEKTCDFLKDTVDKIKTENNQLLSLFTAIYFKSSWAKKFAPDMTNEAVFHIKDDLSRKCDFMNGTVDGSIYEGSIYKSLELPFKDGYSIIFTIPKEGYSLEDILHNNDALALLSKGKEIEEELSFGIDQNRGIYSSSIKMNPEIIAHIPKFDIANSTDIKDTLNKLGIERVFDYLKAEFTLFDSNKKISLSKSSQSTRICLDENGVEAAGYVEFDFVKTSCIKPQIHFNLDQPFAFSIIKEGRALFAGTIVDPTSKS